MNTQTQTPETIDFTRVNNDVNGNPRYVCHFLRLVNDDDRKKADELEKTVRPYKFSISHLYDIAIKKAHKIGGRKFHNKQYGGGIVFQSYNIKDTEREIIELQQENTSKGKIAFLQEWTPEQFKAMQRKISAHFTGLPMYTSHGNYPEMYLGWKAVSDRLGLAYTSSSSFAGYWVCNTEVTYNKLPEYKYTGFALSVDNKAYAILLDKDENEKVIPL